MITALYDAVVHDTTPRATAHVKRLEVRSPSKMRNLSSLALSAPGLPSNLPLVPTARKRPLRTYSKRSSASGKENEPLTKRRKPGREESDAPAAAHNEGDRKPVSSPQLPALPAGPRPAARSSILAYFKPLSFSDPACSSSSATVSPSSPPRTSSQDVASTPPLSGPPYAAQKGSSRPRPPRRLTTRPDHVIDLARPADEDEKGEASFARAHGKGDRGHTTTTREPRETTTGPQRNSEMPCRGGKEEFGTEGAPREKMADQAPMTDSAGRDIDSSDATAHRETTRRRSHLKRPLVQTTLSLSAQELAFTLCGECGILYNPLNERDRKDHARRHAAHLRGETRRRSRSAVAEEESSE